MSWPGAPPFKTSPCNSSCSGSWNVSHRVPPLPHGCKEFANARQPRNHAYSRTRSSAPATPTESKHNRRPCACYSAGQHAADARRQGQSRAAPSLVSALGKTNKTTQLFRIVYAGAEKVGVRCASCVCLGTAIAGETTRPAQLYQCDEAVLDESSGTGRAYSIPHPLITFLTEWMNGPALKWTSYCENRPHHARGAPKGLNFFFRGPMAQRFSSE